MANKTESTNRNNTNGRRRRRLCTGNPRLLVALAAGLALVGLASMPLTARAANARGPAQAPGESGDSVHRIHIHPSPADAHAFDNDYKDNSVNTIYNNNNNNNVNRNNANDYNHRQQWLDDHHFQRNAVREERREARREARTLEWFRRHRERGHDLGEEEPRRELSEHVDDGNGKADEDKANDNANDNDNAGDGPPRKTDSEKRRFRDGLRRKSPSEKRRWRESHRAALDARRLSRDTGGDEDRARRERWDEHARENRRGRWEEAGSSGPGETEEERRKRRLERRRTNHADSYRNSSPSEKRRVKNRILEERRAQRERRWEEGLEL